VHERLGSPWGNRISLGKLCRARCAVRCNIHFGSPLAVCALCPRSRHAVVVPYAVCRHAGIPHSFNDNDHDEMKRRSEHYSLAIQSLLSSMPRTARCQATITVCQYSRQPTASVSDVTRIAEGPQCLSTKGSAEAHEFYLPYCARSVSVCSNESAAEGL